mgnify:CR=1 FL=1
MSMTPQATAFTEMPLGASSFAKAFVRPWSPDLEAE